MACFAFIWASSCLSPKIRSRSGWPTKFAIGKKAAVIFDDAYEHEAWNKSDKVRVVLFVDFVKPLRFPANLLNWLILNLAVFTPYIQEGYGKQREWEQRFYGRD